MGYIFDFGISQDDANIERQALDIKDGDNLICISSAGEVPLNLLALNNIKIKAVDISKNQNFLVNLKLNSVRSLEPIEAAKFLGWLGTSSYHRKQLYKKVSEFLNEEEQLFWDHNSTAIEKGPIRSARFEKYISKFNRIALMIIGRKNMLQLMELDSVQEQENFFDSKINSFLLKNIFKIAFHPRLYKNRGIPAEGLLYNKEKNISDFFFNKFRDFCCATLARKNYYLQFTFFNHILFPECLPDYLTEKGMKNIIQNFQNFEIETTSISEAVKNCQEGKFNKFHLSNIGDWMGIGDYSEILKLIDKKSASVGRINSRFIYHKHPIPNELKKHFFLDEDLGKRLSKHDMYPFYGLAPIKIDKRLSK